MESECPFCPYSDSDCRYVVEHVEICHPEFGDSPFIVKSEEQTPLPIVEQDEGPGQALDVPSAEEYVECECGEMVMLSEFTSHIALHDMEETTADLSTPDILRPSTSPHPAGTDLSLNSTLEASSHVYEPSNNGSSSKHRSRAGHHKNHHGVQNFMGALLGSSSSHSRSKVPKTRQKAPRRLGVGIIPILLIFHEKLICHLES